MLTNFYIGSGDFYGENGPNEKFNKEIVPRLLQLGIKEKDLKEVAKMFTEIYDLGWENGRNNFAGEIEENA